MRRMTVFSLLVCAFLASGRAIAQPDAANGGLGAGGAERGPRNVVTPRTTTPQPLTQQVDPEQRWKINCHRKARAEGKTAEERKALCSHEEYLKHKEAQKAQREKWLECRQKAKDDGKTPKEIIATCGRGPAHMPPQEAQPMSASSYSAQSANALKDSGDSSAFVDESQAQDQKAKQSTSDGTQ